jgi:hypothetical protein
MQAAAEQLAESIVNATAVTHNPASSQQQRTEAVQFFEQVGRAWFAASHPQHTQRRPSLRSPPPSHRPSPSHRAMPHNRPAAPQLKHGEIHSIVFAAAVLTGTQYALEVQVGGSYRTARP